MLRRGQLLGMRFHGIINSVHYWGCSIRVGCTMRRVELSAVLCLLYITK